MKKEKLSHLEADQAIMIHPSRRKIVEENFRGSRV